MVTADRAEILKDKSRLGQKAIRLAELAEAGYPVPPFLALRCDTIDRILGDEGESKRVLTQVVEEVKSALPGARYAVRSAAFSEDADAHSNAGQFKTVLDIKAEDIVSAIRDISEDAKGKGSAGHEKFSVIIQMYIAADFAGVAFTRNPLGGREMMVEWRRGRGAEVVGGSKVERVTHMHGTSVHREPFAGFSRLCETAERIERHFGAPQDIEWVILGDTLHIVQSRPQTMAKKEDYGSCCRSEKGLAGMQDYYYDKKPVGESFVRPVPLALEILRYIHRPGAAIARSYAGCGVAFEAADTFRLIDSFLFTDKEKELKQFFPAYTYFGGATLQPHIGRFGGLLRTLHNVHRFNTLPLPAPQETRALLRRKMLETAEALRDDGRDFQYWLARFDDIYELVFTVNVCAEKALKNLEAVTAYADVHSVDLIALPLARENPEQLDPVIRSALDSARGNSICISDETPFMARLEGVADEKLPRWWTDLPNAMQEKLWPRIHFVQWYASLREEGRWLSVLAMNGLRAALKRHFERSDIQDDALCYFTTLDEVNSSRYDEQELRKRKAAYDEPVRRVPPSVIASVDEQTSSAAYGVSPGIATGTVKLLEDTIERGDILLVERLVPELAQYFGVIAGIISCEGGILSHLAIVAREYAVPVVIDPQAMSKCSPGRVVSIDGVQGAISAA